MQTQITVEGIKLDTSNCLRGRRTTRQTMRSPSYVPLTRKSNNVLCSPSIIAMHQEPVLTRGDKNRDEPQSQAHSLLDLLGPTVCIFKNIVQGMRRQLLAIE